VPLVPGKGLNLYNNPGRLAAVRQSAGAWASSSEVHKHVVFVADGGPGAALGDRLERLAASRGPDELLVRVGLPDQPDAPPVVIELAGSKAVDPTRLAADCGVDASCVQVYAVAEQLRWTRTTGADTRDGVALIGRVRRASGLSGPQFQRHWYEVHSPLAIEHHVGMQWYVQNVVQSHDPVPTRFAADGIAELGFESVAAFETQMYDSDRGRRIIEDDVATFVGGAKMALYRTCGSGAAYGRRSGG
jgi:uncharacterized protein (TIGR02118 family)